jgi:hypothetical protein
MGIAKRMMKKGTDENQRLGVVFLNWALDKPLEKKPFEILDEALEVAAEELTAEADRWAARVRFPTLWHRMLMGAALLWQGPRLTCGGAAAGTLAPAIIARSLLHMDVIFRAGEGVGRRLLQDIRSGNEVHAVETAREFRTYRRLICELGRSDVVPEEIKMMAAKLAVGLGQWPVFLRAADFRAIAAKHLAIETAVDWMAQIAQSPPTNLNFGELQTMNPAVLYARIGTADTGPLFDFVVNCGPISVEAALKALLDEARVNRQRLTRSIAEGLNANESVFVVQMELPSDYQEHVVHSRTSVLLPFCRERFSRRERDGSRSDCVSDFHAMPAFGFAEMVDRDGRVRLFAELGNSWNPAASYGEVERLIECGAEVFEVETNHFALGNGPAVPCCVRVLAALGRGSPPPMLHRGALI